MSVRTMHLILLAIALQVKDAIYLFQALITRPDAQCRG